MQPRDAGAEATSSQRAALEALFSPRNAPSPLALDDARPRGARIVTRADTGGGRPTKAQALIERLTRADGRAAVTQAATDLAAAGVDVPFTQDVQLALLEHTDDTEVQRALEKLERLLVEQTPQRKPLLEARLRRLEENADEVEIRERASRVRKLMARHS